MQNMFNLFGIEELDLSTAKDLLDKRILDRKDRQFLEELIKQRLDDVIVQALIYTIGCGTNVYQFRRVLNPDVDVYGNKYLGIQKQLAPLQLLVENDIERNINSKYIVNETKSKEGISKYLIRFDGDPDKFFIDSNVNNGDTKIIYPSIFPTNFPSEVLDKENVFSGGSINTLIQGGPTVLPVIGITEISNIGKNVTYDKNGKHNCKYSFDDLAM